MMSIEVLIDKIQNNAFDETFKTLYGINNIDFQKNRYLKLIDNYILYYNSSLKEKVMLVSAPGRTEIGGNHTDHQNGCVVTAAINMDAVAIFSKTDDNLITLKSHGYSEISLDIDDLTVNEDDKNTSKAIVRGVISGFKNLGKKIGGFKALVISDVLKGSGLSSSASFEVLIGNMVNHGFNDGEVSNVDVAKIGQYAENIHFFKPSGLLDQMGSSLGGFVFIDFKNDVPIVKQIHYNLKNSGYTLCIVDTGGNHADLTDDYASIPMEMKQIASFFDKSVLREVKEDDFFCSIKELREIYGDRAVLRAIHFFNENNRAKLQADSLQKEDFEAFLHLVGQSSQSSFNYLQNVSTFNDKKSQNIALALAITEKYIEKGGATRVHGGGFAGTIQSYIKNEEVNEYKSAIEKIFSKNSFHKLFVRPVGGIKIQEKISM